MRQVLFQPNGPALSPLTASLFDPIPLEVIALATTAVCGFFAASSLPLILSHRYNVRSTIGLTVFLPLRPPSSPPISGLRFTSATFAPSDDSRPQSHCRLTRGFAACGPIAGRSHQSSTGYCTDTMPQGVYSAGTRARARGEPGNPSHRGRNE